jgi:hypothetical protein
MQDSADGSAFMLASQLAAATPGATMRASAADDDDDARLVEQIGLVVGQRLDQFSMAVNGIRLQFWSPVREIYIEHATVELSRSGQPPATYAWNDDVVATTLLSVLGHTVTGLDLSGGHLTVTFDGERKLRVTPDPDYESWQVNSDDGLLIVCLPGGGLSVWLPNE